MTPEDIGKVASRSLFISIEQIASPRLIKFAYVLGLCAIALWAINHFFYTFSFGFGEGLWGLIEIVVFGLLAAIGLRIACEALVVFFKTHEKNAASAARAASVQTSLIDEVRGAIEDLAGEDDEPAPVAAKKPTASTAAKRTRAVAQSSPVKKAPASKTGASKKPARRTAKRDPQAGSAKAGPTDKT